MKTKLFIFFTLALFHLQAQEIIELPITQQPPVTYQGDSKAYYSSIWQTEVITNVSKPIMEVFKPTDSTLNTGTAVIVAPGGGLYGLSIESEGNMVAKWLAEKGITAFVLQYRLVPTGEDGIQEITTLSQTNPQKIGEEVAKVIPFSIEDGLNAIAHVRAHADTYDVNPDKIGFMGFSAGGAVTVGVSQNYTEANKPNFLVPVYYWSTVMPAKPPKQDAPPMLLICATDDPLQLAPGTIELYNTYLEAKKNVALHMYAKGGHGFGMRKQGLPSDNWILRFYEWALSEKLVTN